MSIGAYELKEKTTTRIGKLFLETRNTKDLKQHEIAGAIGHSTARISQIERGGQIPSEDIALKIGRFLGLDLSKVLDLLNQDRLQDRMGKLAVRQPDLLPDNAPTLVTGGMKIQDKTKIEPIRIHWVPVIGDIPAGNPGEVTQQEAEDHVPVETRKVPEAVRLYALRVQGNSMVKWGIQHGDIVTVDPEAQWSEGDEVVVAIDGKWVLKKIRSVAGGYLLEAATQEQSIILSEESGEVELKGVVINLTKDRRSR